MPAPIKITRPLAALLLREVPGFIAAAKAAGVAPPPVELRYLDGLTREDAHALYDWGLNHAPQLLAAYRNVADPNHRAAVAYNSLVSYFLNDHPQRAEGGPADWPEPLSEPMRKLITGEAERLNPAELPPHEARAFLDWADTRPDVHQAQIDKADPLHDVVTRELREFAEAATAAPPPANDNGNREVPKDGAASPTPSAAAGSRARIDELNRQLADRGFLVGADRQRALGELEALLNGGPVVPPTPQERQAIDLTERLRGTQQQGADRQAGAAADQALPGDTAATPAAAPAHNYGF